MTVSSDKVEIVATQEKIYDFLCDFNNFGKLMPEQVSNWKSTKNECSFNVSNLADFTLRMGNNKPSSLVNYIGTTSKEIDFQMNITLAGIQYSSTTAQIEITLNNLNAFLQMVVKSPLTNFANMLAKKMKEHFEQAEK